MTIPDEIVEAAVSEHFGVHARDVADVPYFDREARSWLDSLAAALSRHGYKITGPTVTEEMDAAHFAAHAKAQAFFAEPSEV